MLDSDFMRILHVNLSNIVLQYCQPIAKERSWYELLAKSGAYVHNLNFCVDDIEETIKKYEAENIQYLFKAKLTPEAETHFYMLDAIDRLGVTVVTTERTQAYIIAAASYIKKRCPRISCCIIGISHNLPVVVD